MTDTLTPPAAAVPLAVRSHHAELQAQLTSLSEDLLAAVGSGAGHQAAQRRLVGFLRTELLPHVEVEQDLLYAGAAPAVELLVRAMRDEHRMLVALVDELDAATHGTEAAVAAGALVVLCAVLIEQEDTHLVPALAEAGLDLGPVGVRPEMVGRSSSDGAA